MATTADFRNGMALDLDGQLYRIVEFQHVKPGKGGAFVRTKLRNLKNGNVFDRTFNAGVRVEQAILAFGKELEAATREASGVLRVACPEPIVYRITQSKLLERFHAKHPNLRVEFVMSDKYIDLAKAEADVALRSGDTDDAELVGRKIADSLWAVYASRGYIERHGAPERVEDLERHRIIGLDETMAKHRAATWLARVAPNASIVARNSSVLGLVYAVKSGIGLAPLPTAIADNEPDLVRVLGPIPELARIWRVLAHPGARRTPRVSAFFDFIAQEGDALRAIFTG